MYLIYSNEVYDDWTIVGVMETKDESKKICDILNNNSEKNGRYYEFIEIPILNLNTIQTNNILQEAYTVYYNVSDDKLIKISKESFLTIKTDFYDTNITPSKQLNLYRSPYNRIHASFTFVDQFNENDRSDEYLYRMKELIKEHSDEIEHLKEKIKMSSKHSGMYVEGEEYE